MSLAAKEFEAHILYLPALKIGILREIHYLRNQFNKTFTEKSKQPL